MQLLRFAGLLCVGFPVSIVGHDASAPVVQVVSPDVGSDRRITFRLYAPSATKAEVVQLAPSPSQGGGSDAATLAMTRQGDIWTATSAPLMPDIYSYRFSIDGRIVNDPANSAVIEEMQGRSSKVAVPGALWTDAGAPAGTVVRHKYASPITEADVEYLVYTPPNYDAGRRDRYPVLYLLHGRGDSAASWVTNGGVDLTVNNLIAQGRAKPMVIVMPLGHGTSRMDLDAVAFEKTLVDELIPRVEGTYHVSRDATTRAIAGVSMGGAQAMSIGMRRADKFASIGLFSVAFGYLSPSPRMAPDPRTLQLDLSPLHVVFIGDGMTTLTLPTSRALAESLKAKGIRVVTVELPAQGHVWPVWRQVVGDFMQTLFQEPVRAPLR